MTASVGRDLILAYLTLPHLLPPAFISVAAQAGYQGISVRFIPANPPVEQQLPIFGSAPLLAETLERLDETGIYINDIEVLKIEPQVDMSALERVLESGARLRVRCLTVIAVDDDEARVADNLATVAERATAYGMRTCLESMVYMGVKTLGQATRVIAQTGRSDIGQIIDPLHLDRAGGVPADIEGVPPEQIACVQLCDAGPRPDPADVDAIIAESRENRLVPGTGTLPLTAVIARVPAHVPVSLEVPTKGMIGVLPDVEIATIMRDAALNIMGNS